MSKQHWTVQDSICYTAAGSDVEQLAECIKKQRLVNLNRKTCIHVMIEEFTGLAQLVRVQKLIEKTLLPLWRKHSDKKMQLYLATPAPHSMITTLQLELVLELIKAENQLGHKFQWQFKSFAELEQVTAKWIIWGAIDSLLGCSVTISERAYGEAAGFLLLQNKQAGAIRCLMKPKRAKQTDGVLLAITEDLDWQSAWVTHAQKLWRKQLKTEGCLPKTLALHQCLGDVGSAQLPLQIILGEQLKYPIVKYDCTGIQAIYEMAATPG